MSELKIRNIPELGLDKILGSDARSMSHNIKQI